MPDPFLSRKNRKFVHEKERPTFADRRRQPPTEDYIGRPHMGPNDKKYIPKHTGEEDDFSTPAIIIFPIMTVGIIFAIYTTMAIYPLDRDKILLTGGLIWILLSILLGVNVARLYWLFSVFVWIIILVTIIGYALLVQPSYYPF